MPTRRRMATTSAGGVMIRPDEDLATAGESDADAMGSGEIERSARVTAGFKAILTAATAVTACGNSR